MKSNILAVLGGAALLGLVSFTAHAQMDLAKTSYTPKEMQFRVDMRKLFSDNLTWERIYAFSSLTNTMGRSAAQARLLANQDEIANTLKSYYGDDISNQIAQYLKQNVQLTGDYAGMVMHGGDKTTTLNTIHENTDAIAALLCRMNMNWTPQELSAIFRSYTDLSIKEIELQYPMPGAIDSSAFDATAGQSMILADTIAIGTMKQFPAKFW